MKVEGCFRVGLELVEEVVQLPESPKRAALDKRLASWLRELFTRQGGRLEARAGAVLLDEQDRPQALTAPFAGEWPRAEVQGLELFATARKAGWHRMVLFRSEPSPHAQPDIALQYTQDMRALGLLFAVEVVDFLLVKPGRHWTFSKVPVLGASLHCEATLSRTLDYLIARAFERCFPPVQIGEAVERGVPLPVEKLVPESSAEGYTEGT